MQLKKMVVAIAVALGTFQRCFGLAPGALAMKLSKDEYGKLSKDLQALYKADGDNFVLELPEGVEPVGGLKSALEKERERAKTEERLRKELEKKFEGIDADEVRRILEKIGGDEEAQLIKAGKIDEVVQRRMTKAQQAHERALKEAQAKVDAANARAEKFSQRVLDNHIRAAATKAGVHQNAVEDALFRARSLFKLDEEGNAVQLGEDGKPVLGKDGKTPFSPDEWLGGMRESAPHWFPAGGSGGGGAGASSKVGAKTIKRVEFEKLDPAARAQTVRDKVEVVD